MQRNMVELQSLCSRVTSGGTPLRSVPEYFEGGSIPWIKTGEVKQGFIRRAEECITELGLEKSSAKLIPANSLIVAMYGDGDTAGNVAVNRIPVTTNQACCNFVVDETKAHYLFLYYYLKANYKNLVNLKLGGSQQNLNAATLKRFPVPAIDPAIQQKIAALLFAYDDLIANNQRRIALLESMAEEIYREWFVRMRFPRANRTKFEKGVPTDWCIKTIGEIFNTVSGGTPTREDASNFLGKIPWVKTGELKNLFVTTTDEQINERAIESSAAKILPERTVVMAMYCAMPDVTILGVPAATNQACCALLPRRKTIGYAWTYFFAKYALRELLNFTHGAAQQNLSQQIIQRFKVLSPSEKLIEQFDAVAKPILEHALLLQRASEQLIQTRNSLLPRLISGKLRVDQLDIQYPPSMVAELAQV